MNASEEIRSVWMSGAAVSLPRTLKPPIHYTDSAEASGGMRNVRDMPKSECHRVQENRAMRAK